MTWSEFSKSLGHLSDKLKLIFSLPALILICILVSGICHLDEANGTGLCVTVLRWMMIFFYLHRRPLVLVAEQHICVDVTDQMFKNLQLKRLLIILIEGGPGCAILG